MTIYNTPLSLPQRRPRTPPRTPPRRLPSPSFRRSNGLSPFSTPSSSYRSNNGSLYTPNPRSSRYRPYPTPSPTRQRQGVVNLPTFAISRASNNFQEFIRQNEGQQLPNHSQTVPPLLNAPHINNNERRPIDFSLYANLRIGQRVDARVLNVEDKVWDRWQEATIIRKWVQMAFVNYSIPCYQVQLTGRSHKIMPELYNLAAFNGGLWDRTGSRPILPPREAIERLKLFQTVLAPIDERCDTWVTAKVVGELFVEPLTVIFHPVHAHPSRQNDFLLYPTPCPWSTQYHPMGVCRCHQVLVDKVYTNCRESVEHLRQAGYTVLHDLES